MSETTIQIPKKLTREAIIQVKEDKKGVGMSISSEEPYLRYDWRKDEEYWEVLDHSREGLDDTRLKAGVSMLYNHNRDIVLGTTDGTYSCDGKKCHVEPVLSEAEHVRGYVQQIKEGTLNKTSVGYQIQGAGKKIGERDGKPIYKFKWMPYEFSAVSIPADFTVGVGRGMEGDNFERMDVSIESDSQSCKSTSKNEKEGLANVRENRDKPPMSEPAAPVINVSEERNAAVAAERKRVADINTLAKHFAENGLGGRKIDTYEAAADAIRSGKTEQEFKDIVVMGNFKEAKTLDTNTPDIGMSKKETRAYSLVRAMGLLGRKQPLDGLEKEASEAHAKLIGKELDGVGFYIPQDVMRAAAFPRGITQEQQRALFAGTYSAAGALVADDLSAFSLIDLLRNQMFVVALGARSLSGLRGNVPIPRQTGGATASWLAEDATITATNQAVGQLNLTPHRLGASTAYTQQLLAQSSIDIENFVRQDLMAVMALKRDLAAINGSGVAGEPLGILNTPNLSTSVTLSGAQSMTYANAVQFETNVSLNNANKGKLAYLATPTVKGNAKLVAEIAAANSIPVWKDDKVNGYPAFATNQVPTATSVIFGNWDDLILADWAENSVIVDPYSLSLAGQVRIVMQMMADNGLRHTQSFSVSTN